MGASQARSPRQGPVWVCDPWSLGWGRNGPPSYFSRRAFMCSCKQNGMLQAQLDPGAWLIHVQLLSPLALFSLSVSYFPHGDKSGPSGSHQLSKGSRAPDEVPGLLTWWEGVTCPSPSQSQARSSNTGWLGDHISRSESRAFQGKLAHVPRRRKGPPWGSSRYLSPPLLPSLAQPVSKSPQSGTGICLLTLPRHTQPLTISRSSCARPFLPP